MPCVDVKFKEFVVTATQLYDAADQITEIVAHHFHTTPDNVSIDVIPQTRWVKNRKDVDIEVKASADPEGRRRQAIGSLANALADWLQEYLKGIGIKCETSALVQILADGRYEYRTPGSDLERI
jgi:phenylpyruvate tautomerase PptA (4-oxalocrotonate tautomerase family)